MGQYIRLLTLTELNSELPLFVFLPGLDGSSLSLQNQLDGLDTLFDLRCLSIPADDRSDWEELVDRAIALINAAQESKPLQPIYLCGESFGGCLALQLAIKAPQLFHRLILVNPASSFKDQIGTQWLPMLAQQLPKPLYDLAALGLLAFLIELDKVSSHNRQSLLEAIQSLSPQSVAWRLSLLNNFAMDERSLHKFKQHTLLIASAKDKLLSSLVESQRLAKSIPNAITLTLQDSGHACLLEREIKLFKVLQRFEFLPHPC